MKYRAYFKLKFTLLSPLSIGSSNSESTDRDIVLDSRGKPVIPATAIAGVFRSLSGNNEELFGRIERYEPDADGNKIMLSKIDTMLFFYDAQLVNEKPVSVRDSVALNKYKSAKKGAKFDFEIVETGAVFIGYVEAKTSDAADKFESLLKNELYLGAKSSRGYGSVNVEYKKKIFDTVDADKWLFEFDMFDEASWDAEEWENPDKVNNYTTIKLLLKQNGGLSIRQYTTETNKTDNKADSVPLSLQDKTPVIPGTSWAGMFRSHIRKLLNYDENGLNEIFGFVDTVGKTSAKSKIRFSESKIYGAISKTLTRNAIDRFTNGTKDGALFTETTIFNGTTELEISLKKDICDDVKSALTATILDLHNGYAAVGGLTSIGRGMFKIEKINTKNVSDKKFEDYWNEEKSKWNLTGLKEDIFGDK